MIGVNDENVETEREAKFRPPKQIPDSNLPKRKYKSRALCTSLKVKQIQVFELKISLF